MTPQDTKEVVFITVFVALIAFGFSSFIGYQYGQSEGQKFFDDAVKQAKEAQAKAEEAQIETMKIQSEARRILMEARQ